MTLQELYSFVEGTKTAKRKVHTELEAGGEKILVRELFVNGASVCRLTVYVNGYVLYEEDNRNTVFHISEVIDKDFIYSSSLENTIDVSERRAKNEELLNSDWKVVLLLEGNDRISKNREKSDSYHIVFRFDETNDESREEHLSYTPNLSGALEKTIELQKIKEVVDMARSKMSDEVWNIYFNVEVLGMHQDDIAKQIGISQQAVSKKYLKACRLITKYRKEFIKKYYED